MYKFKLGQQWQRGKCTCLSRQWFEFNPQQGQDFFFFTSTALGSTQPHKNGCQTIFGIVWELAEKVRKELAEKVRKELAKNVMKKLVRM